jgi:hypothetical protein
VTHLKAGAGGIEQFGAGRRALRTRSGKWREAVTRRAVGDAAGEDCGQPTLLVGLFQQPVLLQAILQSAAGDAEQARGFALHAMGALHSLLQDVLFQRFQVDLAAPQRR